MHRASNKASLVSCHYEVAALTPEFSGIDCKNLVVSSAGSAW